ncbi:MAG: hypothetical protein ACLFV6_10715 [Spirulinaceae cyanobacterium]
MTVGWILNPGFEIVKRLAIALSSQQMKARFLAYFSLMFYFAIAK